MDIQITSRGDNKASQELQATITAEIGKLEKFYDKIESCHVILGGEGLNKTVEITMGVPGNKVVGEAKAENLGKALDDAAEKVGRQLKKLNEREKSHK
jgi:ribosomal subunit interface protein